MSLDFVNYLLHKRRCFRERIDAINLFDDVVRSALESGRRLVPSVLAYPAVDLVVQRCA